MTGFAEAPEWWTDIRPGFISGRFVGAVKDLLDNHLAGGPVSTRDLAELLWPEANVRGDAQVKARQRMYKVLMRLARTTLKDYCEQSGEPNKFGGIPYHWHALAKTREGYDSSIGPSRYDRVAKAARLVIQAWDESSARPSEIGFEIAALREAIK